MNSGRRTFGTVVLVDLAVFAFLFALYVLRYTADLVAPVFALRWEIAESLIAFFRWLPALQFLGVSVALGSLSGRGEELLGGALLPASILSGLLAAAALVSAPYLSASREAILEASAGFNSSLDAARHSLAAGDLAQARSSVEACGAIDRNDPRVVELSEKLAAALLKSRRSHEATLAEPARQAPMVQGEDAGTAKAYYLKALEFVAKKDYFNAHSYASAAAKIDPSYTDAVRLAARAWEELAARGSDTSDRDRALLYARKLEGYGLLRSKDPIGAYRIFKELSEKRANDPDVGRYLAESLADLDKAAFFKEEADWAFAGAVLGPVFLRLPSNDGSARILAAAKAAWAEGTLYLLELEYLETGAKNQPRLLVRSPMAKLAEGKLLLVSVSRERPAEVTGPTWSPGPEKGPKSMLDVALPTDLAFRLVAARIAPSALSFLDAWKVSKEAPVFGVDPAPIIEQLLARLSLPFGLFTASALGALAGLRFRRRKAPFPRRYYALLPFMAAALLPVVILVERADSLITLWSASVLPGLSSLWLSAGIRAIILLLAVMLMAGSRDDHGAAARP